MKQILFAALALFLVNVAFAEVNPTALPVNQVSQSDEVKALSPEFAQMAMDKFLSLTPAEYQKMTGEKLGVKKSIELKMAQKALKKELKQRDTLRGGDDGITKELYIVLAILGLGWVAMGIKDDWTGSDWIINLILTLLCWIPGLIHALMKMKKYYN